MVTHSPRAFPWEIEPPVGNHHVKEKHRPKARARRPRAADLPEQRVRTQVPAAALEPALLPGSGMPARGPTAGRRRSGRLNVARTTTPKPSTPRQRKRAASRPSPRPRSLRIQNLRRRVVTQQKVFFPSVMQPAGLPRTPRELAPQPGTLLLPPPAGKPFAMSWIVNASGSLAALWMAGRSGP